MAKHLARRSYPRPHVAPDQRARWRAQLARQAGNPPRRRTGLDAIGRLMRQPGTLAAIPPPRPLHKMGQREGNGKTATTGKD